MSTEPGSRPPLDSARLSAAPWPVEVVPEASSTNAILIERARAGADPQVLVTEHQTAGRGRLDRSWETPARAALTLSVLLRPQVEPSRWPWLPLLAGVALRAALAPTGARLKWPNDVLLNERKVAGILVERVEGSTGPAAVVGIGLNVTTTRAELPVPTATSLALELDASQVPERTAMLLALLQELEAAYRTWIDSGDAALAATYSRHCATLGQRVRVDLPGGEVAEGVASGLDGAGRLLLATASGELAVGAGDVVHVRPDDQ